jgi:glycosyltransferase involved in cell wall biosynthesis
MVSVVIPAWNAAATIERAVRSALMGLGDEGEIVIVDDGSTDGTADVVTRLAAGDRRVRLVPSPANEGASAARNRALAAASGTWLTFLDADDRFIGSGLAALIRAALARDVLAVVGQRVWTDGRIRWRTAAYDIPDIRRPGRTSLVARPGLLSYASATGKLFHRSITKGLSFDGRVLGDQPWTVRALLRAGGRIEVVDEDVYEWSRPKQGSGTSSITAAKRGSARLAAEAARVAVSALAEVREEAAARISDDGARDRLVAAYGERIVRSDLAGPVRRAVDRGDDGTDELFDAIAAFIGSAPMASEQVADAVATEILRPPLEGWQRVGAPARAAYVRLLRAAVRTSPGIARRLTRRTMLGPGVSALLAFDSATPPATVDRLLARERPLAIVRRAFRLARLGLTRLRTVRPAQS